MLEAAVVARVLALAARYGDDGGQQTVEGPFSVQALTATDSGAIGVSEATDSLTIWRFPG